MNILSVTKTIPVRTTWIDSDQQQIKSITYDIKYSLRTEAEEGSNYEEAYLHQNVSFQIANNFLYDQLHQSLVYDMDGKAMAERSFSEFNNNFMFLPSLSEATFASTIHCKLNAMIHPSSHVEVLSIEDKVEGMEYSVFNDDGDYNTLPTMDQWLGELSFWKTPWWERKDFSTFDNVAQDQEELDIWFSNEKQQEIVERMQDPITEIEKEVMAQLQPSDEKDKGKLIEVDFKRKQFKPKLVPKDKS
jgi:hypothetical protein|tara:strand:+ start:3036 stop:3773 length:738 start_codon:yes stop_codon:yes gene_type:complete